MRGIDVSGDIIYAFCKSSKLYSIDPGTGAAITILDSITWSGSTIPFGTNLAGRWISCHEDVAYLADWTTGIQAIDISDPNDLNILASLSPGAPIRSVFPYSDKLFCSANISGEYIVDITSPTSMDILETLTSTSNFIDLITLEGDYLYICQDPGGLSIWNVSDLSDPISFVSTSGTAVSIDISQYGDTVFIADFEGIIHEIDVSNPTLPTLGENWYPGSGNIYRIKREGNLLLSACGSSGIWVYAYPESSPSLADSGYYEFDSAVIVDIALIEDLLVAADANGHIHFLDLSDFVSSIDENRLPDRGSIKLYPNPFNSFCNIELSSITKSNLSIYDISGNLIDILQPKKCQDKTLFQWAPNKEINSGIYYASIDVENSFSKKMLYIK